MGDPNESEVKPAPQDIISARPSDNRVKVLYEDSKRLKPKPPLAVLMWHFVTIGPCCITAVILALNFSQYVIGTEIGKDSNSTQDILGVIQVASKVHEVLMVIGLAKIAQQSIYRSLIYRDGTVLGLLGADQSLGDILFLISKEFWVAFTYGFWRRNSQPNESNESKSRTWRIRRLVVFIIFVCILCTVLGPASAVLMAPQLDWFPAGKQEWASSSENRALRSFCYPYILMDPRLGGGEYTNSLFDITPIPPYWRYSVVLRHRHDIGLYEPKKTLLSHRFVDHGIPVTVNSTTTWNRELYVGNRYSWQGGTNFTTVSRLDTSFISNSLFTYEPPPKTAASEVQFFTDITGIQTNTICRKRRKLPCNNGSSNIRNSSSWCFMFPATGNDDGPLLRSQDLLLVADRGWGDEATTVRLPRFWMTEGLRTTNDRFTDSIVFVFEDIEEVPEQLLTVCSTSATLKLVTAMSTKKPFTAEQVQVHERLDYFKKNDSSAGAIMPPRTILYHETWLDMIHQSTIIPGGESEPLPESITTNYTTRADPRPTENIFLKEWSLAILNAQSSNKKPLWSKENIREEAGMVEVVVGGAYLSMLARLMPSSAQYSIMPDWYDINYNTYRSAAAVRYPAELMPEPIIDCIYRFESVSIYHKVYGYGIVSTASILSIMVLLIHCFVVLVGSLRQCYDGRVIQAWDSLPDYGALCLGRDPENGAMGGTCARIGSQKTLQMVVEVKASDD